MKMPILSICIATYNRAKFIGETLENIIPQLTDAVEIVIVDGASTDNTQKVVHDYIQRSARIRYVLLPANGGVDHDYNQVVELAQGEYCWLLTDDDLLKPDAISTVLTEIPKGYSLIVVNAQVMNKDLSKVLQDKLIPIDANERYDGSKLEQLFQRVIPYISFIGCVVINRALWMQREKTQYFGTEFIHVGVIFQTPLPTPALIIAEPYSSIRYGNAQWTSRAFEIWMFKWPKLLYSLTSISEKTRQKHQMTNPLRLMKIIVYRALGAYSLEEYRKWFMPKGSLLSWEFVAWIIAILPVSFVNLVVLSLLKIIKKQPLFIYDLENNKNNYRDS